MNGLPNQNQNVAFINTSDARSIKEPDNFVSDALSLEPDTTPRPPLPSAAAIARPSSTLAHTLKKVFVLVAVLFVVTSVAAALLIVFNLRKTKGSTASNAANQYNNQLVSLQELVADAQGIDLGFGNVVINGGLRANNGIVLAPTPKPSTPSAGQLYFDQQTNQLSFYNGQQYASLEGTVVRSIGGASGGLTLGSGLSLVGNQLTATFPPGLPSAGGSAGLCLVSTTGTPTFQACPGSSGSSSLNGLSGVLTLANASGVGSTITIDDASTAVKGIASFNASNFSASSGAINTIQNIGTSATPTFGGITTSGAANLNGNTVLGASSANRLSINSEIVGGSLILQGATDDAFTLTLNISDPTANRTITIPNTSGTLPIATSGSSQNGVSAFVQNGSAWNGVANLGTNDAFALNLRTNGSTRVTVDGSTGDTSFTGGVAVTGNLTSGGAVTFQNSANSISAFKVQNTAGDSYLAVDTSGAIANFGNVNIASTVNLGTNGAGLAVAQTINVGTNSTAGATNTVVIGNSAATASTVTVNGGTGAGAISLQAGTGGTISIGTSNAVTLAFGSTAANGATFTSKSSTTGFQIQNASSVALFTVDTTNARLYVGPVAGDTVGTILVMGKKTTAGDPTGVEGAIYYNSSSRTMRCYQDGMWSDCLTANPIDRSFTVQDEFTSGQSGSGTIGALGWQNTAIGVAGTATYNSAPYLTATNPGILVLTTTATTNQGSTIRAAGAGVASWTLAAGNRFKSTMAEDNTAANTTLRIGLHAETSATARPTTGIWWEADPAANANWEYCYGTGGAAVCAASSVAIASTTLVRTEIRLTATGVGTSAATFIINGNSSTVSAVTIDTATKVSPAMSCFTQANAAGVCAVDYIWAYGEAPSGR